MFGQQSIDPELISHIDLINPALRNDLMKIAYKLLISPEDNFHELTPAEQELWKTYPNTEIFELITGVPDAFPEFRFDWITPSATLSYTVPANATQQQQQTNQGVNPQPAQANPQPTQPQQGPSNTGPTLRDRPPVNYKETRDRGTNFKSVRARAAKRCQTAVTKVSKFLGSPSSSSASSK